MKIMVMNCARMKLSGVKRFLDWPRKRRIDVLEEDARNLRVEDSGETNTQDRWRAVVLAAKTLTELQKPENEEDNSVYTKLQPLLKKKKRILVSLSRLNA